jgi:thiamine pyrophosphate-dependent acetolactate synthase large subunit-like protein
MADIPRVMKEAFFIASSGRPGPVLIDLPKDVLAAPCPAPFVDKVELPGYHVPEHAEPGLLKQAAAFLAKAQTAAPAGRPRRRPFERQQGHPEVRREDSRRLW